MQNSCSNSEACTDKEVVKEVVYAGFWVRLAAYLIDSLIVFVGLLVVRLGLSGVSLLLEGTFLGGNILFHYTLKDIVLYIAEALYFVLFTYYTGTTLGKKALNLCVVSANEDEKLTLLNVVYRETIGRFLSGFIVSIGYILIGLDKEKRGLPDILCDTRVVYAKKVKVYPVHQAPPVQYTPPVYPAGETVAGVNVEEAAMSYHYTSVPMRQEQAQPENEMPPQQEEQ